MPELIPVTSETVDARFPELPRLVRLALGFGSKLQHGTLDVTLADGRVQLGGNGPGPAAAMKIYDYGFASRLCVAATLELPRPICTANGTRPILRSSSICSASTRNGCRRCLSARR